MYRRLNRVTKMIVMAAGLVLIGGSAVGGIAFAASRTSDAPLGHPTTTSSPDDRAGKDEDANKQDPDHTSATPSGTCTADTDDATGEREEGPTASRSPEADDNHHSGDAIPTATGSHHPEPTEAPEARETNDSDRAGTGSHCDD